MVQPDSELLQRILTSTGFVNFLDTYNLFISIALAIITISILVLLFVNITKLSTSNGNEQLKRIASNGILVCLGCLGFIGAIDTVYAMLMSIIFGMG